MRRMLSMFGQGLLSPVGIRGRAWIGILLLLGADCGATRASGSMELTAGEERSVWQGATGDWRMAGDVSLDPQDPGRLKTASGSGVLVNGPTGRTVDLISREHFGDIALRVEFQVPERSNSGVYFMGRYEIQVLDQTGVETPTYPGNQCGGVYPRWLDGGRVGGKAPDADASRPAGAWQSFEVVFRAPRFDEAGRKIAHARFERVLHNGVLVHQDAVVTGPTRAARYESADESPTGPIQLQGDHGPVAYRNLQVRSLAPAGTDELGPALVAMDTLTKPRFPHSDLTTDQQLDLVREAGFSGVAWDQVGPDQAKTLWEAATARGLTLDALYFDATLTHDGLAWRPDLPATMQRLGGTDAILWLHIGSTAFPSSSPAGDAVAVPALRALADQALTHGLRVALYPHVGDWTERVQDAVRVVRKAAHPALGVTFNLCHCLMVGDEKRIPALLTDAAPYLMMVTVNGADSDAARTSWKRLIQPLDQGSFALRPMIRHLEALGFIGPVAVQGYGIQGDVADILHRSVDTWRAHREAIHAPVR